MLRVLERDLSDLQPGWLKGHLSTLVKVPSSRLPCPTYEEGRKPSFESWKREMASGVGRRKAGAIRPAPLAAPDYLPQPVAGEEKPKKFRSAQHRKQVCPPFCHLPATLISKKGVMLIMDVKVGGG